jgi:hypothetical protein
MPDVFISYAQQDKEYADGGGLERILRPTGLSIWRDNRLQGGTQWSEEIRTNLNAAKCVVVIWSKNSWQSPWVKYEAFYGYVRGILVPLRVDDVVIEAPFSNVQWIQNDAKGLEQLISAVRAKVSSEA